jgi:uncharacterized membrane protein YphA (DoxX/SURF4 family)
MKFNKLASSHGSNVSLDTSLPRRNILTKTASLFARAGRGIVTGLKKKNTYVEIISALLIILFIYTGINKLMDIGKFKYEMGRSPFIENMSGIIAYSLPPGEILLALLLIIKRTRLLGLYLSFALMTVFTGYIWLMLNYAYDLPCSCGGIISKLTWHEHLIFNSVFTGLTMIAVILQSKIVQKNKITSQT